VPGLSSAGKPTPSFWIIGEGDLRADLEKLVSDLKLSGSVRFSGARFPKQTNKTCCQRVAVYLMPSRGEGLVWFILKQCVGQTLSGEHHGCRPRSC